MRVPASSAAIGHVVRHGKLQLLLMMMMTVSPLQARGLIHQLAILHPEYRPGDASWHAFAQTPDYRGERCQGLALTRVPPHATGRPASRCRCCCCYCSTTTIHLHHVFLMMINPRHKHNHLWPHKQIYILFYYFIIAHTHTCGRCCCPFDLLFHHRISRRCMSALSNSTPLRALSPPTTTDAHIKRNVLTFLAKKTTINSQYPLL